MQSQSTRNIHPLTFRAPDNKKRKLDDHNQDCVNQSSSLLTSTQDFNSSLTDHRAPLTNLSKPDHFIYDQYTTRRGTPVELKLDCTDCGHNIMNYQKDGPGRLLRCYLDRIMKPQALHNLQNKYHFQKDMKALKCQSCHTVVGLPMTYESENRLAFRLRQQKIKITEVQLTSEKTQYSPKKRKFN